MRFEGKTARWVALLALLGAAEAAPPTSDVAVTVEGLRNDEGLVHLALFSGPAGFPRQGRSAFRYDSLPIEDGRVTHVFEDVPYGVYAIALIHDENADEILQTNAVGVPREGFGASNDATRLLGPPRFADAAFEVDTPREVQVLHPRYYLDFD